MLHQCVRLYFESNKRFIAEQLCEKRNEPFNTCKGQCQLKKMSQKAKDASTKVNENLKSDFICEYPIEVIFLDAPVLSDRPYCGNTVPVLLHGFDRCVEEPPDELARLS